MTREAAVAGVLDEPLPTSSYARDDRSTPAYFPSCDRNKSTRTRQNRKLTLKSFQPVAKGTSATDRGFRGCARPKIRCGPHQAFTTRNSLRQHR